MARLTRQQAEALAAAIYPKLGYLARVRERLERIGFPSADPLWLFVRNAEDALQRLWVELHYRSVGHGTGRPPERDG